MNASPALAPVRTLFAAGAMFGFFFGLARMPLIDALTLGFTAPLMVTALSVPMLGEHVGWRRWTAVLAGFAGVLMILRPGSGALSYAGVAVLFAAICYVCLAITARKLATTESTFALSIYVITGPLVISGLFSLNGTWRQPDALGWLMFVLAGSSSVLARIGLIGAYRRAPPALLARRRRQPGWRRRLISLRRLDLFRNLAGLQPRNLGGRHAE